MGSFVSFARRLENLNICTLAKVPQKQPLAPESRGAPVSLASALAGERTKS
jgi:hypothetical protein